MPPKKNEKKDTGKGDKKEAGGKGKAKKAAAADDEGSSSGATKVGARLVNVSFYDNLKGFYSLRQRIRSKSDTSYVSMLEINVDLGGWLTLDVSGEKHSKAMEAIYSHYSSSRLRFALYFLDKEKSQWDRRLEVPLENASD